MLHQPEELSWHNGSGNNLCQVRDARRWGAGGAGAAPAAAQPPAASCPVLVVKPWLIPKLVGGAHCSFSGHAT